MTVHMCVVGDILTLPLAVQIPIYPVVGVIIRTFAVTGREDGEKREGQYR